MRSLVVLIAVTVVFGAVFVVSQTRETQAQVAQPRAAQLTWEYKVVNAMKMVEGATGDDQAVASVEEHLNSLGGDGWEFSQAVNNVWVFKRRR